MLIWAVPERKHAFYNDAFPEKTTGLDMALIIERQQVSNLTLATEGKVDHLLAT